MYGQDSDFVTLGVGDTHNYHSALQV